MAKVFYVSPGRSYTVTASEGTTVTYPGITTPAAIVGASGSVAFNCTGTEITVSDNSAKIAQNFNNVSSVTAGAGGGGLPKTDYLIYNSDYTEVRGNLDNLKDGGHMFYEANFTTFSADLPELTNGDNMFNWCRKLTSWDIDMPALTYGYNMFHSCTALITFTADLSSLTDGTKMLDSCTALTIFTADLSSLTNGEDMFHACTSLISWDIDLPSLTDGTNMFYVCNSLTTFTADLSSLTRGTRMFYVCSALTTFAADLPSLIDGYNMFYGCQLNKESALRVLNSIPSYTSGSYQLTIGIHINHKNDEEVLAAIEAAKAKGWTMTVDWNG